jgi:hypothetical protein
MLTFLGMSTENRGGSNYFGRRDQAEPGAFISRKRQLID